MGEEEAKQQPEEAKAEEKKEEKTEENKEDKAEEKTDEADKPPTPFVLSVDLHCMGCAKKIERSILKIRGVEGVVIDMSQNQVTIKGVVEPQAVCTTIEKKAKRRAQVLSPLPAAEGEPMPQVVASQVSGLTTVELNVNMHCEACAGQLKRKILKMKGVRTAETELSSGKVTVTGSMDANRLVEYVYRRTKKQAKVVPQPEPAEKPKEEALAKPSEEPIKEEKPPAAEGEEAKAPQEGKNPEEAAEKKGDAPAPPQEEEEKKEGGGGGNETVMMMSNVDELSKQKMMYYYQPLYVMERIPPPQLFSDENPNACCIT
ncbi:heavy metal-associated isoprenylated plant protein 9-like isoform X1 [Coffea arabica]|uniref:Heavy metal-associated isoprenylated plant protein 9-like isoform X1 n=1 Tax=Coffea arabica TaxID=13443 RepID=A0A6P6W729_COFAR|nr:heavy metal-associated isoprenylated plant protein 9-like isoform X1 [Coffea arabica]